MLNLALNISLYVFLGLLAIALIMYFPRFKAWFGAMRPQKRLINSKRNKIALIIPARNESKAIGDLLMSIKAQTYGRQYFDAHFIVKDPADKTVNLVKEVGGIIHIAEHQTCKGDALDFCMKRILSETPDLYDAFLIVDADCMMDERYLEEMNNSLASGAKVIQGKKLVKNYLIKHKGANSMASSCNGLIWTIIDDMGNRYKSDRGLTVMTVGTGLMLTTDLVKELDGWPYRQTLTEDIELMYDCMSKRIPTFYYSYAKLYLEESTSLSMTNKRRNRWLTGVIDSKRLYHKRVKAAAGSRHEKRDKYYVLALWPVYFLIGLCTVFMGIQLVAAALLIVISNPLWLKALIFAAIGGGTIYLSFLLLTVSCLIVERKNMPVSLGRRLAILLMHPFFYMGYIPIISRALFLKGNRGWEVIERIDFKLSAPSAPEPQGD